MWKKNTPKHESQCIRCGDDKTTTPRSRETKFVSDEAKLFGTLMEYGFSWKTIYKWRRCSRSISDCIQESNQQKWRLYHETIGIDQAKTGDLGS